MIDPFADDDEAAGAPELGGDYIESVFGPKGHLAARFEGYQPRSGQVALARKVDEAITGATHLMAEGPTGCHAAGQGILMFDGSVKRVEDVLVGDRLMGPDSEPRRVCALARGEQEMVDVVPVKGAPWRVNAGHMLTLVRTNDGNSERLNRNVRDALVADVMTWTPTQRHLHKLFRVGVEFYCCSHVPRCGLMLPIEPYWMGLLLGDGSLAHPAAGVGITTADPEIADEAAQMAARFGLEIRVSNMAHRLSGPVGIKQHPILAELRRLGLSPIACGDRFVPHEYKTLPRQERLELLAGLIDTDGSLDLQSGACFDYISKSKRLADDVAFVARSLGFAAYVSSCQKSSQSMAEPGTYYRLSISGDTHLIPTRVARKRAPWRRQKKSVLRTGFELVPTGTIEPYFGFSIDRDGRFLLDDFTVTHNTGKSIAYAVPASYHASQGRRVVMVTANIALQEQLVAKDLPLLREILPWGFTFASLKGRNNYLCVDRMAHAQAEQMTLGGRRGDYGQPDREQTQAVTDWAYETETGDVSELDFVPDADVWRQFSRSSDECKGTSCKSYKECFAYAAKRKARDAMIVVTNYHMLFAHVVVRRLVGRNLILPGFDVAILDEAHKAADIAREFFGFKISGSMATRIAKALEKLEADDHAQLLARKLRAAATTFFGAVSDYKKRGGYKVRLKEKLVEHPLVARYWPPFDEAMDLAAQVFRQLAQAPTLSRDAQADHGKMARRAADARSNIECAMRLEEGDQFVYFLEDDDFRRGRSDGEVRISICAKPISVAQTIREELYEGRPKGDPRGGGGYGGHDDEDDAPDADEVRERTLRDKRTVVCTSATLSTADREGPFAYIAKELGCPPGYLEIIADSPFDWAEQCLFIVPTGMPDPSKERDEFAAAVPDVVDKAIELAGGRTLCLFTSYKALNLSYERLRDRGGELPVRTHHGYRLLKQGEMPRGKLIETFKKDVRSVLLGTESFWAGVDVPGESLSCVVIDKLPFVTPDDPVIDAISAKDKNWFFNHSVPRAIIQFKQGFGRGVRAITDKCVVVLCDNRVIEKPSYGGKVVRALPPVSRSRKMEHIAEFLPPFREAEAESGPVQLPIVAPPDPFADVEPDFGADDIPY